MNPNPNDQAARRLPWRRFLAVIAATWALWGGAGCDEISARRSVQEANKAYERGQFEKAAALYEGALAKAPHLDTAHYNAGLTYQKMFRPGVKTPENMEIAESATRHFAKYLEKFPTDSKIIELMTNVWVESGDYQSALSYWERELAKNPNNTEIVSILAGISRRARDWDRAIGWHMRHVEMESDPLGKAAGYKDIGKLIASRLRGNPHDVIGYERLEIADTGIAALQKAAELDPNDAEVQTSLGFLYGQRALAHGATWAQMIEVATARHHYKAWSALNKQAREASGAQDPSQDKPESDKAGGAEASGG